MEDDAHFALESVAQTLGSGQVVAAQAARRVVVFEDILSQKRVLRDFFLSNANAGVHIGCTDNY